MVSFGCGGRGAAPGCRVSRSASFSSAYAVRAALDALTADRPRSSPLSEAPRGSARGMQVGSGGVGSRPPVADAGAGKGASGVAGVVAKFPAKVLGNGAQPMRVGPGARSPQGCDQPVARHLRACVVGQCRQELILDGGRCPPGPYPGSTNLRRVTTDPVALSGLRLWALVAARHLTRR